MCENDRNLLDDNLHVFEAVLQALLEVLHGEELTASASSWCFQ